MRLLAVLLFSVSCALPGLAQDLTLQAVPGTFDILPGEPVTFELRITNHSGKDLQVIRRDDQPPFGFMLGTDFLSPEGKKIACCGIGSPYILPATTPPSTWPKTLLKAGETVTQLLYMDAPPPCCPMSDFPPGNYTGQVRVRANIWEGGEKLRTTEATMNVPVRIREAQGEDAAFVQAVRQALQDYDASRGKEWKTWPLRWQDLLLMPRVATRQIALSRFPTSTYAADVIHGIMSGFMQWDPNDEKKRSLFLGALQTGSFLSNSYPDDTGKSKDGWRSMDGKEAADWWAKWYDIILKNHPDIWFADELRLKRAIDQLALKNYQTAEADLGALAKDSKSPMQGKAQLVLDLMKQKGWVKDGSTPPAQPAPAAPAKDK